MENQSFENYVNGDFRRFCHIIFEGIFNIEKNSKLVVGLKCPYLKYPQILFFAEFFGNA